MQIAMKRNLEINEFTIIDTRTYNERKFVTIQIKVEYDWRSSPTYHIDVAVDFTVLGPRGEPFRIYNQNFNTNALPQDRWPYYESLAYILVKPYTSVLQKLSESSHFNEKIFPPITENIMAINTLAKLLL